MKKLVVIIALISFSLVSYSQNETQLWYKLSPEIRLNIDKTPFEFRWRPDDHIILPTIDIARTDIMLGLTYKNFKLFNYSKFDELGRSWTGVRFDYNLSLFQKKLLANIQERYFFGLNKKSEDHYYLIQYIRYAVVKNFHTGVLSYGKWDTNAPFTDGDLFIGPSLEYFFPMNFNLNIAITHNVLQNELNMLYVRLGYKILWKRKSTEESN